MGIDRTDYIVYGWKLPYEMKDSKGNEIDLWDDKYLPMFEGHKGEKYTIIGDMLSDDYIVFGKVLARADDPNGWNFVHLKFQDSEEKEELKDKYREVFDVEGDVADPYLFIFTHFS